MVSILTRHLYYRSPKLQVWGAWRRGGEPQAGIRGGNAEENTEGRREMEERKNETGPERRESTPQRQRH